MSCCGHSTCGYRVFCHTQADVRKDQAILRAAFPPRALQARPLRVRPQVLMARAPGRGAVAVARARLPSLRAARIRRMDPPPAGGPHPRMQANAGDSRRRDAHRRAGRQARLAGAAAAPIGECEPLVVLELVRLGDGGGARRNGDRRGADQGGAALPSRSSAPHLRGGNVGRRHARGDARRAPSGNVRGRIRAFVSRLRCRLGPRGRDVGGERRRGYGSPGDRRKGARGGPRRCGARAAARDPRR